LGLDPNPASVHLNDALRYGETQAGAALFSGDGIVGLLKLFMSALGQTRTLVERIEMSASPPKADIAECVTGMSALCLNVDIDRSRRAKPGRLCVLAIANGMTAEQEFPGRNPSSTQPPARSWLVPDSRGAHCLFGILAHAESILPPLRDNHRELTLCSPT